MSSAGQSSGRVLFIDDEPHHAQALADALRVAGYEVEVAISGAEGIDKLRTQPFDLVITDLVLGDIDGLQVLREARAIHPLIGV
ncbi:MAG: response regulator, partial [Planctomycetota bacterium]